MLCNLNNFCEKYFSFTGFGSANIFKDIERTDIADTEIFIREHLTGILNAALSENNVKYGRREMTRFFGDFSSKPTEFSFLPDEKEAIYSLALFVKKLYEESVEYFEEEDGSLENGLTDSIFGLVFGTVDDINTFSQFEYIENQGKSTPIEYTEEPQILSELPKPSSQTHCLLNKMMETADRNYSRTKAGYRFDENTKRFATYIRLQAGRLAYSTIHRNMQLAIPSLSTTNLFARKMGERIFDAHLRTNELLKYLTERKLDLIVSLSEDATRIDGRIQYDSVRNQIVGFVSPIDKETGMPIPDAFPARSCAEIVKHFSIGNSPAKYVNVVMAQPLAKYPPFCLLLYGLDTKYTAEDVDKRWNYIEEELRKAGIKVLTFSADSEPRNNSAQRKRSLLGHTSEVFNNFEAENPKSLRTNVDRISDDWFRSGLTESSEDPYDMQDVDHILTKIRNALMKTRRSPHLFSFGKYYIQINHLYFLLHRFRKDQHCLTKSTLNPVDRQNYSSAVRMCSDKVIHLLEEKVPNSEGTVAFLTLMRNIIDAFSARDFLPLERIRKMWYTVFLLRIWRRFVGRKNGLKLKNNFLTQNTYSCVELNAHNLILIMLYLKKNGLENFFLPFLYNSQACEAFFRRIRSFTSTNSTKVNCSIKEILERINKIQLLNDITTDTNFEFPNVKDAHKFPGYISHELPTKDEIFAEIEKCRKNAIEDAMEYGLLENNFTSDCISCCIPSIKRKPDEPNQTFCANTQIPRIARLDKLALPNYAHKFVGKPVPETSPYVEVCTGNAKRHIVKKTSLCWMLRPDHEKLSSDRIIRVRDGPQKPKNSKPINKKTKQKKCGLIYNPCG